MIGVPSATKVKRSKSTLVSLQTLARVFARPSTFKAREQSQDKVASLGSSDLDGLRADCRGSDNLVASDKDDLVAVAAR